MIGLGKKVKTCVIHDDGADRKRKKTLVNGCNKGKEKLFKDKGMCSNGNKAVVTIYKRAMVNGKAKMVKDGKGYRWSLNEGVFCLSTGILCSSTKAFANLTPWLRAKDSIVIQTCDLSEEELNDFLALYPIPHAYHVILPKSSQTFFDASPGYVGTDTHSFSLQSSKSTERLTHLMVMRPPSSSFRGSLICVEVFNSKSYKDKLPPNIEQNPMFQRLGQYPTSVRVFHDPIIFLADLQSLWEHGQQGLAILVGGKGIYPPNFFPHLSFWLINDLPFLLVELAFKNFVYAKDEGDLSFLPKEPSTSFGTSSPSVSVDIEPLKADKEPVLQPAEVMADSGGRSSRPPVKRKLASRSSNSRATRAKTSTSKDDVPFLTVSDDDKGLSDVPELKDATACHLKISAITPIV
ncbi:hypothetical protein Tco_1490676 [Tanacetum coccineum]